MATFCTRGLLSSKAVAKASIPTSCLPASQWSAVMRTEDSGSAIRFCRRRDTPSDSTTDTATCWPNGLPDGRWVGTIRVGA